MIALLGWALFGLCASAAEEVHTVPYLPPASSEGHIGVVRVESRSAVAGEVRIVAVDDAGRRVEAGVVALGPRAAAEFDTEALESGDAALGLSGTGTGEGGWRLELATELDIEARAYARSEEFPAALHDAVLVTAEEVELPLFHPGGDARRSVLRMVNAGVEPATVSVRGIDDAGGSGGPVTVELGAWEARSYAADELESGTAAGLSGSLGDGEGRWRLVLSAERGSAYATSLLLDGSGILWSVPGGMSRGAGGAHRVALLPSASDGLGRLGLVRVVNRWPEAADVSVEAFDATDRSYEELRLSLGAESSSEFDSTDLEHGAPEKGLEGSTGPGEGDWWLELSSGSEIEVLSYVETPGGLLSPIRGAAGEEMETGTRYEALLYGESGELRLLNAGGEPAEARVTGTDDAGAASGSVRLTLPPWTARTLSALELESGGTRGLSGSLGAGTGSWRLVVESDVAIDVLSLVSGSGGRLSDVSRRGRPVGAPARAELVDATGPRADLWVSASSSASALLPGESFDLSATVNNRGGRGSRPTTLRYYFSADAAIRASDAQVGTDRVGALAASASSTHSVTLAAPSSPGTYYYGACADVVADESDAANNCSTAAEVTVEVPSAPDLAVDAVSASEDMPAAGATFALSATVRNWGNADAGTTTLRYYRSADAAITTTDAEVGAEPVGALSASESSARSIALTAPSTAGTYYYGACADAVAGESDTANNCSSSAKVKVGAAPAPDLVVDALAASENNPSAGARFTLSATVRNRGGGAAGATTLRYYRSADTAITTADAEVGAEPVGALSGSESSAQSITLTAPSTAGTYYYGACADVVAGESDTSNNCSAAVEMAVGVTPAPDLVVGAVSTNESAPAAGARFTLSATVRNRGSGPAAATTLRYYRSSDAAVTTSDTEVGTDAVDALAASASGGESIAVTAPSTEGTYYYGACVDVVEGESDTANNCSSSVKVSTRVPAPDLVVGAPTASSDSPAAGATFTLSATVENRGDGAAAATTLRYYRSSDAAISTSDAEVGTDAVDALAASATGDESIEMTAPSSQGTYYYGACVDAVSGESDTANNCSASVAVTVAATEPGRPDLFISYWAGPGNASAYLPPGTDFVVGGGVMNRGNAEAAATTVRIYRSANNYISTNDTVVGTDAFPALPPGGTSGVNIIVATPPELGAYYYGHCVDPVANESDTTNNCGYSTLIRITVMKPDLVVESPSVSDARPEVGAAFTLRAKVANRGGKSRPTTLRYYRSADATISTADTEVGTASVISYLYSHSYVHSIALTAPSVAGIYYYGACVEAVSGESDTANNCSAAVTVTAIAAGPRAPDLKVVHPISVAGSDLGDLATGDPFTLTVRVQNVGNADSDAVALRYYRSTDATISDADTLEGSDTVAALAPFATSTQSIALTAPSAGDYHYGGCVDAATGETDATNNCLSILIAVKAAPSGIARPDGGTRFRPRPPVSGGDVSR